MEEIGRGDGEGYSVNVPFAPYTQDEVWLRTFDEIVPPLLHGYGPDLLFIQLGIDTHFRDPLTHLQITTQGFTAAVERLLKLGTDCQGVIAVGGGGYHMGAVARAWTMALAEMADFALPEALPDSFDAVSGLDYFEDRPGPAPLSADVSLEVEEFASQTVEAVKSAVFGRFGL